MDRAAYLEPLVYASLSSKASGDGSVPASLTRQVEQNTNDIAALKGAGDGSINQMVSDAIANVVADAPADFDTLKEIADYIAADKTGAASMQSAISANTAALDGHTVRANVPSDAVFTDTVYDDTEVRGLIEEKADTADVPGAADDDEFDTFLDETFGAGA